MSSGNGSKKVKVPYKFNTVQLNSLKVHPKQAEVRQITDEALQGLGKFIDKVGLVEEIAINERTGHIIFGHQRCKVLIDKGFTSAKVKVFDVDEDTEDLMFTNLNSQAISGAFTDEAKPWVQSLEARLGSELYQDVGLQMLEVSLADPEVAKDGLTDADDVPATPKEAKTKTGDLYQLGDHRLLCGDATKKEDVERLMGGEKADMVFTDPPYGIDYQDVKKKHRKIANDCRVSIQSLLSLLPSDCASYVCCNWRSLPEFLAALPKAKAVIVWDKGHGVQNLDKFYKAHEFILYSGVFGGEKTVDGDVWRINRGVRADHPTAKPVELIIRALMYSSQLFGIIIDPFLGSGTTMIACEQLDRKCYGMEIDQLYCDVIVKRWEDFTGRDAILIPTGQTFSDVKPSCVVKEQSAEVKLRKVKSPQARNAQRVLSYQVKVGHIRRATSCEECGVDNVKIDAAHYDYAEALKVRWLCRSCHIKWDKANPKGGIIAVPLAGEK